MTYLVMSLPFIGVGLIFFAVGMFHANHRGTLRRYLASWAAATAALLVLTAVFDNVMMAAGFYGYGTDEISGLQLGLMPLEDFLYPIAGALLLSGVWQLLSGSKQITRGSHG